MKITTELAIQAFRRVEQQALTLDKKDRELQEALLRMDPEENVIYLEETNKILAEFESKREDLARAGKIS